MKKLILLSAMTFVLSTTNSIFAQKNNSEITSITKSDRYTVDPKSSVSILEGNVAITFGKLDVSNADKVIIDENTNKIIVVGFKEFAFKGKIIAIPTIANKPTTIEYTKGDEVAYLK